MKSILRKLIREEVRRLFEERTSISKEEAQRLYNALKLTVDFNEFFTGMNVELEHQDVTGGDLNTTAKIVMAHLGERPDYYAQLKKYVEPTNKTEDAGFAYDDGSGPKKKYDDSISGGMGTMMS